MSLTFRQKLSSTFRQKLCLTFRQKFKVVFDIQIKIVFDIQIKIVFDIQIKIVFDIQTKILFDIQTKIVFDNETKQSYLSTAAREQTRMAGCCTCVLERKVSGPFIHASSKSKPRISVAVMNMSCTDGRSSNCEPMPGEK